MMPMPSNSLRRKANAQTVLVVIPIRPREMSTMYAKASTPSPSSSCRNRFSPGHNARQNIAGPMESPGWTPLEQAIVLISPESIGKCTSAGLVP